MVSPEEKPSQLIQRALAKNRDALEELLLDRYDWLRSVAEKAIPVDLRMSVNTEEVLHEAFIRILRGFPSFTPQHGEASLFYWLKTIVRNSATDAIRKRIRQEKPFSSHRPRGDGDDDLYDEIAHLALADDPKASVVARGQELKNAFRVALAGLNDRDQRIIEMLYLQQLSIEQVADSLGCTVGAVRGYRQRAREKIREALIRLSNFV